MRAQTGRMEPRIRMKVPVRLESLGNPSLAENTLTENVCSLGIRVVTKRPWQPGETLQITSPVGDLRTPARVVYCQSLRGDQFAVGLQFQGSRIRWGKEIGQISGE